MAYFDCIVGGASGDGVALIVECDSDFAGSTITADNGEDVFTEICPSVSPYTVKFEGIPIGTYTISGIAEGQTFTTQFTVLDYETTLNATPEGATVLPVNDIQIWLHCANIWDKNYTTLDEVLADNTTLLALISSNNAADYMARSTDWASSVCANQTAMGYIGNNDYCADTLLADATWRIAICNSAYFESVLNVKVPTMTSDTTPSGEASASSLYRNDVYQAWKAFDGASTEQDRWIPSDSDTNPRLIYKFNSTTCIRKAKFYNFDKAITCKIQGSNTGNSNDWHDLTNLSSTIAQSTWYETDIDNNDKYLYYAVYMPNQQSSQHKISIREVQFYGRA